jgi:hypothetical protein
MVKINGNYFPHFFSPKTGIETGAEWASGWQLRWLQSLFMFAFLSPKENGYPEAPANPFLNQLHG